MSNANPTIADRIAQERRAFISHFDTLAEAVTFEDRCLSAGDAFLPECARGVLVSRDAETPEYWAWLVKQVVSSESSPAPHGNEDDYNQEG